MQTLPTKVIGEVVTVTFDFTNQVPFGESLSSPVVTAEVFAGVDPTPSGIISGSAALSGTSVTQKISDGLGGVTYKLVCTVQGASGRQYIAEYVFVILSRTGSFGPGHGLTIGGTAPSTACVNEDVYFTLPITDGYAPYGPVTISAGALPVGWIATVVGSNIVVAGYNNAAPADYSFTLHLEDFVGNTATFPVSISLIDCTDSTLVYVVNTGDNRVQYFNIPAWTSAGTIAVGSGPIIICRNNARDTFYVSNQTGDSISVIDIATNTVTATWSDASIDAPLGLAISSDDLYLYVTHVHQPSGDYAVSKINTADGTIADLYQYVGSYFGAGEISINSDNTAVYPTTFTTNNIHRLTSALALTNTTTFADDNVSSYYFQAPDTNYYVATIVGAGVTVQTLKLLDPADASELYSLSLTPAQGNGSICVLPDRTKMYVTGNINGYVTVVDITAMPPVVSSSIYIGATARPRRLAASAGGAYVFVSDSSLTDFYVIDTSTDTVTQTITTGAGGNGVAVP